MNRNSGSPPKPRIGSYSRHFQSTSGENFSYSSGGNADADDNENKNGAWDYVPQTGASLENNRIKSGDHVEIDMRRSEMVLDYFPDQEHEDVRNRNDTAYDEQYDVSDSDSPEVSPREDLESGDPGGDDLQSIKVHQPIEMTTFRTYNALTRSSNDMQFDEAVPVEDEDDEAEEYNSGHHHLYSRRSIGHYTPMRQEEQEDYEPESSRYTRPHKQVPVDASIRLFQSPQRSYGATSRDVKIEKTIKFKDGPPFGDPLDQKKITERNNALLEKKASLEEGGGCFQNNDDSDSYNSTMPNDAVLKKKRKKKGRGNDDGSDSDLNSDINGNPTISTGTHTNFPRTTTDFAKYPYNGRSTSTQESETSNESTVKRRGRKKKPDGFVKACELPGHKGDQDVEKILSFIEGQDSEKTKKVASISNGPQNGPDRSAVKKNKKNKLVVNNEKDDVSSEKVEELSGGSNSMGNYPSETSKGEDNGSSVLVTKQQGTVVDGSGSKQLDKQAKEARINTDNNTSMKKLDKLVKDKGSLRGNEDKITRDSKETVNEKDVPNKNNMKSKTGRLRKDSVEKDSVKSTRTEKNSSKESTNSAKTKNEKIAKDSGGREIIRTDSVEKERMEVEKQDALKKLEIEDVAVSVANHIMVVNSLLNVPSGAFPLSDNYRFTDLPVPKVEEEFTEVRKKKKNKTTRDEPVPPPPRSTPWRYREWQPKENMAGSQVREAPPREHVPRETHRPSAPVAPRSMTPPLAVAPIHQGANPGRSFSPSAFPVLGSGTTRCRRSSAGDAPLDTPDDSDIESVRSLPPMTVSKESAASPGGGSGGGGVPTISYARMAAAATQTISSRMKSNSVPNNSHVPNFISVDAPGATPSVAPSTTEDVTPGVTVLVNDTEVSGESQRPESVVPSSDTSRNLPPTVDEFPALDFVPRVEATVTSTKPVQVAPSKNPADVDIQKTCVVEKQHVNTCTDSPHDVGATRTESVSQSLAPQSGSIERGSANKLPSQPRTCDELPNMAVPMEAMPKKVSGGVIVPKSTTTARTSTPKTSTSCNKNTKGVIFLDNESDNMDLGISFGSVLSEPAISARRPTDGPDTASSSSCHADTHTDIANLSLASSPSIANISHSGQQHQQQPQQQQQQQQNISSAASTVNLPPGGSTSAPSTVIHVTQSPSSCITSSNDSYNKAGCSSVQTATPTSSTPSSNSSDSQSATSVPLQCAAPIIPVDGITKVARINGIIIPAPLGSDGQFLPIPAGALTCEDLQFGTVDASMFSQPNRPPVETDDDTVTPVPVSDNSTTTTVTGRPLNPVMTSSTYSREDDPNFDRGNFYIEDAIMFLTREWETMKQKQHDHPNRVVIFELK